METTRLDYESIVLEDLEKYGEIPVVILRKMVPQLDDFQFKKMIEGLRRSGALEILRSGHIRLNRRSEWKSKLVDALWVFAQFADDVGPYDHGPLDYPAQMFFIKTDADGRLFEYEISVFKDGDLPYLRTFNFKDNIKYIFVVPNEDEVETYMNALVSDYHLKPSRFLVACLERDGINIEPEVNIYACE